eukprot:2532878-Rhodomonas_salina.4
MFACYLRPTLQVVGFVSALDPLAAEWMHVILHLVWSTHAFDSEARCTCFSFFFLICSCRFFVLTAALDSAEDVAKGYQNLLIVVEMFVYAICHKIVFPYTDFRAGLIPAPRALESRVRLGECRCSVLEIESGNSV